MHPLVLMMLALNPSAADPRAVVERALEAHGGAERLSKNMATQVRATGTLHQRGGIAFSSESVTQLPGQFKTLMRYTVMGQGQRLIQVLNGDRAWVSENGRARELDAKGVRDLQENLHAERITGLVILRDKGYELTTLDEIDVAGQPAVGVRVNSKGRRSTDLYFDKASGLLVSSVSRVVESATSNEVVQQKVFTNFKAIDGVPRPTRVLVFRDGSPYLEIEVIEVRTLERLADSAFAAP